MKGPGIDRSVVQGSQVLPYEPPKQLQLPWYSEVTTVQNRVRFGAGHMVTLMQGLELFLQVISMGD